MLRPERMSEVTMLCQKKDAETVINTLADLKALHITDHKKQTVGTTLIDIGKPQGSAEELSSALVATRNLLAKLPPAKKTAIYIALEKRIEQVKQLANQYSDHEEKLRTTQKNLQQTELQLQLLHQLSIEGPIESIFRTKSVESFLLHTTKHSDRSVIDKLSPLLIAENKEHHTIFITIKKQTNAKDALAANFEVIDLSPLKEIKGTTIEASAKLAEQHKKLKEDEQKILAGQKSFAQHAPFLEESEHILAIELLKAQAPLHFGTTKNIMLINGYVPTRRIRELDERIGKIALIDATTAKEAPVVLHNPPAMNNFETLMRMYALPKYHELDPTSLLAITFPVFFGFMLGDIGYGLCALAVALAVRFAAPKMKQFANIFVISAISSIIFGFVFGEFFATSQLFGLHLTPLLERSNIENVRTMFTIALSLGLFHINLGLLLGVINSEDGLFFATIQKGSWVLVELGFIGIAAKFKIVDSLTLFHLDVSWATCVTLLIAAAFGLWYSEQEKGILKAKGIIEMLSMFSNMISYARLVAVGLASVYLAFVTNNLAGGMFTKGGLWLVAGVLILLFGHALNLALGLLGPFLHSLRLHYVEFFTKFYEGGGEAYHPFGEAT